MYDVCRNEKQTHFLFCYLVNHLSVNLLVIPTAGGGEVCNKAVDNLHNQTSNVIKTVIPSQAHALKTVN